MAKKSSNDENLLLLGIAGLIGAAIASPSNLEKRNLSLLKQHEYDFHLFQQNRLEFENYLNEKYEKARRRERIGEIRIHPNINQFPEARELLKEVVHMFVNGYYRSSCVFSAVILEHVLSKKFANKKLFDHIEDAHKQGVISNSEKSYFHGLRLDRNDFAHAISQEISENDANLVILIMLKLLDKILR